MPKLSNEKCQKIIEDYLSGMTQKEVGIKNEVTDETVGKIARRFGHETRSYTGERTNSLRKWNWDFDFFYRDTPQTAYWAGFLMADGNIQVNGNMQKVIIFVAGKDLNHIYSFMDDIGLSRDALYRRKEGYVGFHLQHPSLQDSLLRWGVVPRKTYDYSEPTVSTDVLPHYLRGWCDGDGMVYSYGTGSRFCIAGNPSGLYWYKSALQFLGYDGTISIQDQQSSDFAKLLYVGGANNVAKIRDMLLVDESFKLERRWNVTYNSKFNYIYRNCEVCDKEFGVKKYRAEREPNNGRFCSRNCFNLYQMK